MLTKRCAGADWGLESRHSYFMGNRATIGYSVSRFLFFISLFSNISPKLPPKHIYRSGGPLIMI